MTDLPPDPPADEPRRRYGQVPPDAFARFVALGPGRTYAALAAQIGCTTRAIEKHASRDQWQARLEVFEERSRLHVEQVLAETLEQMNVRHVGALHKIQEKALKALAELPISTAAEAVRALAETIKLERLVRGEATDRVAVDVAEMLRRHHARWLSDPADDSGESDSDSSTITVPARPVGNDPSPLLTMTEQPTVEADDDDPPPNPPGDL